VADLCYRGSDYSSARQVLTSLLEKQDTDENMVPDLEKLLARTEYRMGNYDRALTEFQSLLARPDVTAKDQRQMEELVKKLGAIRN